VFNYINSDYGMGLKVTKCVKQSYQFQDPQLFDDFRWMINEAIRTGIQSKITSKLSLRNTVYKQFKNGYNTSFINMAVFKAHAILKNYRKIIKKKPDTDRPYIRKNFIIVDSCQVRINGKLLTFYTKPRQFTNIILNDYVAEKLSNPDIKIGNLIIREKEVIISYTQNFPEYESRGCVGIDMNFENITATDSKQQTSIHNISRMTSYKQKVRENLSHFTRNDVRVSKKLKQKYGKKQKDKEHNILHNIANQIVSSKMTPILERLKYIRNQGRRGDGKGRRFRFKLNSWSRFKLQQIIDYKSRQNGIIPIYINPKGTSSMCSACEGKLILEENRLMRCSVCDRVVDRDVNASQNILKRGMRFVPIAPRVETMKQSKDAEQIVVS